MNERHFAQVKLGEFTAQTKLETVNHTYKSILRWRSTAQNIIMSRRQPGKGGSKRGLVQRSDEPPSLQD